MPTYDYQCDKCGHAFEAIQSMKDDPLSVCPECDEAALRRIITGGTGVIFKGSGFYVNDSRKQREEILIGDEERLDVERVDGIGLREHEHRVGVEEFVRRDLLQRRKQLEENRLSIL